jgi:uncharacterized membrane protein YciS (DUF1049 family)
MAEEKVITVSFFIFAYYAVFGVGIFAIVYFAVRLALSHHDRKIKLSR